MDAIDLTSLADRIVKPRPVDLFAKLREQDNALVRRGWHAISRWWLDTLQRFYNSGKRALAVRAGRRGGKSSTWCRVAVCETLHGQHDIPPGDIGVFAFFSVSMREARARLATICDILRALGVDHERSGDEVRVVGRPLAIRVYASSLRSVGFTLIGTVFDELARWLDRDTGANPATEVLRSVRPAMATQRHAHEFLSSSPWATLDAHYEAIQEGETDRQCVAIGSTWECNPTLTEAQCRAEEPDEQTFLREYAARPMAAGESSVFDHRAIEAAVRDYETPRQPRQGESVVAGADFGFQRDSSALVVVHLSNAVRTVGELRELRPHAGAPLRPSDVCSSFAAAMRLHGAAAVMADAHYRQSIVEHLAEHDLGFLDAPTDVPATYVRLRTLLHQGRVVLPRHRQLIRDLAEVTSRPTATGRITIQLPKRPGGGHADMVSALVLACWQEGGVVIEHEDVDPYAHWTDQEKADLEDTIAAQHKSQSYITDHGSFTS